MFLLKNYKFYSTTASPPLVLVPLLIISYSGVLPCLSPCSFFGIFTLQVSLSDSYKHVLNNANNYADAFALFSTRQSKKGMDIISKLFTLLVGYFLPFGLIALIAHHHQH